jgi:MFS family permease
MLLMAFSNMASAIGGMVGTLAAGRLGDRPRRQLLACSAAGAGLAGLASSFMMLVNWLMDFHAEEVLLFLLSLLAMTIAAGVLGGDLGRKWIGGDRFEPTMGTPAPEVTESIPRGLSS